MVLPSLDGALFLEALQGGVNKCVA